MILVLRPSHSHKPLKTCWKYLLKGQLFYPKITLTQLLTKSPCEYLFVSCRYCFIIIVRLVKRGSLSQECDWLWTTGWPGFQSKKNLLLLSFLSPFLSHLSPHQVPSSQFFLSSLLLHLPLTNSYASWISHLLVLSVIRHTVMYCDHCKHHFGIKMQMWQDSHGLLPWLMLVPHAGGAEIFKLWWFIVHI